MSNYDIVSPTIGHTYDVVCHIVPTILFNIVGHDIVCTVTTYDIAGQTSKVLPISYVDLR